MRPKILPDNLLTGVRYLCYVCFMNIVTIIKRKGAALVSGLSAVLESRPAGGVVSVRPRVRHKRYTFAELMQGATPESVQALNAKTAWALDGGAVGGELA